MTKEVKRVGIRLSYSVGKLVEVNPPFLKLPDHLGPLFRVGPLLAHPDCAGEEGAHLVGSIVAVLDHPQLSAVRIEFVNQMRGDLHLAAIIVILTPFPFAVVDDDSGRSVFVLDTAIFHNRCLFRDGGLVSDAAFVDLLLADQGGSPSNSGSAKSLVALPV